MVKTLLLSLLLAVPAFGQLTNNMTNMVTLVREATIAANPVRLGQMSNVVSSLTASNALQLGGKAASLYATNGQLITTFNAPNAGIAYRANAGAVQWGTTIPSMGLTFQGQVTYDTVINNRTNIYLDTNIYTGTNYFSTARYTTNFIYDVTVTELATNILEVTGGWVFNNSYLNATNASYIFTPHLRDTKGGSLVFTGSLDFAGASVSGLTNGWSFGTAGALTNAAGPGVTVVNDAVVFTTNGWVFGTSGAITNETDPLWTAASNAYLLSSVASATYVPLAAFPSKADSNKVVSVAINGVTNGVPVGLGGVIDLGTLATVTGSVSYASNAGSLNGITGGSYALTNQLMKFTIGLPAGAALVYGSTNDALLAGVTGNNAYWDELQYNDTTQQRARWVIPPTSTTRYLGGAVTNKIYWRGTSTVGAVVWQMAYIGLTNGGLTDLAYQNQTIGSNTVSSVASNINLTTIVLVPTNCPVGSPWAIELQRLPANASDTMVNDARVISIGVNE